MEKERDKRSEFLPLHSDTLGPDQSIPGRCRFLANKEGVNSSQLTVIDDADDFGGQVFSPFPNCCIVILPIDKTHLGRATTLSPVALLEKARR